MFNVYMNDDALGICLKAIGRACEKYEKKKFPNLRIVKYRRKDLSSK